LSSEEILPADADQQKVNGTSRPLGFLHALNVERSGQMHRHLS
jgi:hypothetical protein